MDEQIEVVEKERDLTKVMWLVVGVLIVLMIGTLLIVQRNVGEFGSRVRAKHILVRCNLNDPVDRSRALAKISDIRDQIVNGADFDTLAKRESEDTFSAARGGDLGYHEKGEFDVSFEDYVWSAEVGTLSEVVQSSYGFHLIIVIDRNLSEQDAYEAELQQRLKEEDGSLQGQDKEEPTASE